MNNCTKITSTFQSLIKYLDLSTDHLSVLESATNTIGTQILNLDHPHSLEWLNDQKNVIRKMRDTLTDQINTQNSIIKDFNHIQLFKTMNCVDHQITLIVKCCLSILKAQNIRKQCDTILQDIDTQSQTLDIQQVNSNC